MSSKFLLPVDHPEFLRSQGACGCLTTTTNIILYSETALFFTGVPESYEEDTSDNNIDFWMHGIKKSEDSTQKNETFELVPRKQGTYVIQCRYAFRVKPEVGSEIRIVANSFREVPGLKYSDIFAPIVSLP